MTKPKIYDIEISISEPVYSRTGKSMALTQTGTKNKVTFGAAMTMRQIIAFGNSSAFSNDSIEVEVKIPGEEHLQRTINPYHMGYSVHSYEAMAKWNVKRPSTALGSNQAWVSRTDTK